MKLKIILGSLVFLSLFFFRIQVVRFLDFLRIAAYYLPRQIDCELNLEKLRAEKQYLRTQLEELSIFDHPYLKANVYVSYPFTGRGVLIIDKGEMHGLSPGFPVLAAEGVLLGKVGEVKRSRSEVILISDPSWKSNVRVGENTQALLYGGNPPKIEFIPRDDLVRIGDKVKNVSSDFPFGFLIGEIVSYEKIKQEHWARGHVGLPYKPEKLFDVLVITDFP